MSFEPDTEETRLRKQDELINKIREQQIFTDTGINTAPPAFAGSGGNFSQLAGFNFGIIGDIATAAVSVLESGVKTIPIVAAFLFISDLLAGANDIFRFSGGVAGQKVVVKPKLLQTITLKDTDPSVNPSTVGNLILGADLTLSDQQTATLRFQSDVLYTDGQGGWILENSSLGGSGAGGSLPVGTAENQHIEWNNSGLLWEAVSSIAFNNNDATLATLGDGRFANGGTLAWRDGLASQDMFMSFNSNQEWRFDSLTAGGSGFNIRENFINMIEQQSVPTGTANTIKVYAKEDTDTVTKLFYKDSSDIEHSVGIDGANKTLSNLTVPTSINTSLIPDTDGLDDIGSPTFHWDFTYTRAVQFNNNKTPTAVGIGNNAIGADATGMWFNIGSTLDNFRILERNVELMSLVNTGSVTILEIPDNAGSTTAKLSLGDGTSRSEIFFSSGDLILDRVNAFGSTGVQLRANGLSTLIASADDVKIFKTFNANAQDLTNVVDIKSNGGGGATTGTIGELITSDGGFNYFMRNNIAWESNSNTKIVFDSSGITVETDGTNDDILINALGISSNVVITSTDIISILADNLMGLTTDGAGSTMLVQTDEIRFQEAFSSLSSVVPVIKAASGKIAFQVSNSNISRGTEGTIQIPDSTSATTNSATLDGLFGNADGCIGLGNSTSSNPSLWIKSSGTWRRAFLS